MHRVMVAMAVLAIPAGATTMGLAGPAAAAASAQTCTKASGSETGTITFSGCTGGLGKGSAVATSLATGGTITWKGKGKGTTTFSGSPTSPGQGSCSKGSTEYDFSGTVTTDTSGKVLVGSAVSGQACLSSAGAISLVKHTKFGF